MLNYHELTLDEPKNSPAKRKQFVIITTIMITLLVYHAMHAGVFYSMDILTSTSDQANANNLFEGGEFLYKLMTKDYAASGGTLRTVKEDLGLDLTLSEGESTELEMELGIIADGDEGGEVDLFYTVFMDDPGNVPGGKCRFAGGVLFPPSFHSKEGRERIKSRLLRVNEDILRAKRGLSGDGGGSSGGGAVEDNHSRNVEYRVGNLPKVEVAVAQHPFTDGAFSALLQSYKIIPAFRKYAKENKIESADNPVVISTCSAKQQMCTYYMPLRKMKQFFLGNPAAEEYVASFSESLTNNRVGVNWNNAVGINFNKVLKGLKRAVGNSGSVGKTSEL